MATTLDLLNHPFPRCLSVQDEFILDVMFDPRVMPLFMVEDFVIMLDPNGPQSDATKEMPNFDLFEEFLPNLFPKHSLFPMKAIVVASPHPAQLMHDKHGPSPSPPCLNAISKFVFNQLTCVREAKDTLLNNGCRCNVGPPLVSRYCFMPN